MIELDQITNGSLPIYAYVRKNGNGRLNGMGIDFIY